MKSEARKIRKVNLQILIDEPNPGGMRGRQQQVIADNARSTLSRLNLRDITARGRNASRGRDEQAASVRQL